MPPRSRPKVVANFALTWDGRISTRKGTPSDFSSKRDKHRLLEIRSTGDAVMASVATVSVDGMTMGMPDRALRAERVARGQSAWPIRVLLTNSGSVDPGLRVFEKTFSPVVIFSTERMPRRVRTALAGRADVHLHPGTQVDLPAVMRTLRKDYAVRRLICEGGGMVFRSLLQEGLIDELFVTLCPRVFGSATAPTVTGRPEAFLPSTVPCRLLSMSVLKDECFLRYAVGARPARSAV